MPNFEPAIINIFQKIENKEPIYRKLSGDMHQAVNKNFDTEGGRTGNKWKPLKPSTIRQRIKGKKWPGQILQRSGAAIRSIDRRSSSEYAAVFMPPSTARYFITHVLGLEVQYHARSETFKRLRNKSGKFKKLRAFEDRGISQGFTFGSYSIRFPKRDPFQFNEEDYRTFENTIVNHFNR